MIGYRLRQSRDSRATFHRSVDKIEQTNFEKIVIPPTCVCYRYLFNGICFHFQLCVTRIPGLAYGPLSVTALIDLVTLTFDLLTSK